MRGVKQKTVANGGVRNGNEGKTLVQANEVFVRIMVYFVSKGWRKSL